MGTVSKMVFVKTVLFFSTAFAVNIPATNYTSSSYGYYDYDNERYNNNTVYEYRYNETTTTAGTTTTWCPA